MKFRVNRDPKTIKRLREILSDSNMLDSRTVARMDDEQVAMAAERFMESFSGIAAQVAVAFQPIAEEFRRFAERVGITVSRLPSEHPLRRIAECSDR